MKRQLDSDIDTMNIAPTSAAVKAPKAHYKANADQFKQFLDIISETKPALLSVYPGYAENYVPKVLHEKYPRMLTELFDPSVVAVPLHDLVHICRGIADNLSVIQSPSEIVEKVTRSQAK